MTFGLSETGFSRKRLPDILADIEAAQRSAFGETIDVGGDSVFGQLNGIMAERLAELWELAEGVYYSAFPDSAVGVSLANAAALTGQTPQKETFSTVTAIVTGDPGTEIPAGSRLKVVGTNARFVSLLPVTIGGGGTAALAMQSEEAGPVVAMAGTLTAIDTPIAGWASATNPEDARLGRNAETDAELRARRLRSLVIARGGTTPAIDVRLRELAGVTFAGVRENRTDEVDDNGLPAKSFEAFVIGGDDQAIVDTIWDAHPIGIESHGSESGIVVDTLGNEHVMHFSRGAAIPIYVWVSLDATADYPATGDQAIKDALVAYGATLTNGGDVLTWRLRVAVTLGVTEGRSTELLRAEGVTLGIASARGNVVTFTEPHSIALGVTSVRGLELPRTAGITLGIAEVRGLELPRGEAVILGVAFSRGNVVSDVHAHNVTLSITEARSTGLPRGESVTLGIGQSDYQVVSEPEPLAVTLGTTHTNSLTVLVDRPHGVTLAVVETRSTEIPRPHAVTLGVSETRGLELPRGEAVALSANQADGLTVSPNPPVHGITLGVSEDRSTELPRAEMAPLAIGQSDDLSASFTDGEAITVGVEQSASVEVLIARDHDVTLVVAASQVIAPALARDHDVALAIDQDDDLTAYEPQTDGITLEVAQVDGLIVYPDVEPHGIPLTVALARSLEVIEVIDLGIPRERHHAEQAIARLAAQFKAPSPQGKPVAGVPVSPAGTGRPSPWAAPPLTRLDNHAAAALARLTSPFR